jgi:hypothetical protein
MTLKKEQDLACWFQIEFKRKEQEHSHKSLAYGDQFFLRNVASDYYVIKQIEYNCDTEGKRSSLSLTLYKSGKE